MIPILFQIGPLKVYSYGLMLALGFLVTGIIFKRELKRTNMPLGLGDPIIIGTMLGGILGAKIYSVIEGFREEGISSLRGFFSGAGLVWYGGFMGALIVVFAITKFKKAPFLKTLDIMAPLVILGYAFGRMGCFLSGDGDYGPPTDLPWGMAFPNGIVPTNERVHPTPLYEIILSLMIFAYLWKVRTKYTQRGRMLGLFLILAGIERFVTEFWRLTEKVALGITMAQYFSMIAIIVGIVLVIRSRKFQLEPILNEKPLRKPEFSKGRSQKRKPK